MIGAELKPNATYTPDLHTYLYPQGVLVTVQNFYESRGDEGPSAEIAIETDNPLSPGLLHRGRIKFLGPRSKSDTLRAVKERVSDGFLNDFDFGGMLTQILTRSLNQWRKGEPAIRLVDVEESTQTRFLLYPFIVKDALNLLFGDGGSMKSTLALICGLSVCLGVDLLNEREPIECGPVLYLDWEDNADTHAERLRALCKGLGVRIPENFYYRPQSTPLPFTITEVRQEIGKIGAQLVIGDSVGMGGGDDPETANTKIHLFGAARAIPTTWLWIDHVSKGDKSKPFGSVYTRNIVRMAWAVQAITSAPDEWDQDGSSRVAVALRNEKINRGRLLPPQAFYMDFMNEAREREEFLVSLNITRSQMGAMPEFDAMPDQWEALRDILIACHPVGKTEQQLAGLLKDKNIEVKREKTISNWLRRHGDVFKRQGTAQKNGSRGRAPVVWTVHDSVMESIEEQA